MAQNDKTNRTGGHSGQQAAAARKARVKQEKRAELVKSAAALGITPEQLLDQRKLEAEVHRAVPRVIVSVSAGGESFGESPIDKGLGSIYR